MDILVTAVALAIPLLLVFIFLSKYERKRTGLDREFVRTKWQKITYYLDEGEAGQSLAVTEADKLLDYVLQKLQFSGEVMADRLRSAQPSIVNYDSVWQAHKLRNQIVHETEYTVKKSEAKRAIQIYRKALKGLGAL